jgi:hypothetical protein
LTMRVLSTRNLFAREALLTAPYGRTATPPLKFRILIVRTTESFSYPRSVRPSTVAIKTSRTYYCIQFNLFDC